MEDCWFHHDLVSGELPIKANQSSDQCLVKLRLDELDVLRAES